MNFFASEQKRKYSSPVSLPVVNMPIVAPRKPRARYGQVETFDIMPDPHMLMGGDSKLISRSADRRALWTFFVVLLTAMCLHSDQNLASPNLSAIAADFGFDEVERDAKVGALTQFGFFIIGGIAAILFGPLADTTPKRIRLMALVVVAGNIPCIFTPLIPHGPE